MVAIVAAVLFGLALVFEPAGFSISVLTAATLTTAGLLCIALHLAGIGTSSRSGGLRGSRR